MHLNDIVFRSATGTADQKWNTYSIPNNIFSIFRSHAMKVIGMQALKDRIKGVAKDMLFGERSK